MEKTLVATFLPRAFPLIHGLAGTDIRSIVLCKSHGVPLPEPNEFAGLAALGLRVTPISDLAAFDLGAIEDEARARCAAVMSSAAYASAVHALPGFERTTLPEHLARIGRRALSEAIALIDSLDAVASLTDVCGVVVMDEGSATARTLIRWGAARGIPSVMITHGASPLYPLFTTKLLVDDHYLYGERIVPSMIDLGVRHDQVHFGTFYGHQEHRNPSADARERFRARFGFASGDVVVALALGFHSFSSAFETAGVWPLSLLAAFVEAIATLAKAGTTFRPLIKHRWPDPDLERLVGLTAAHYQVDLAYFDGPMAEMMPGIDILCGSDSNTLIEAGLHDCPIVDLVYPWHWHIGPQYAAEDAVTYADARTPDLIAQALAPLIDAAARRSSVEARRPGHARVVAAGPSDAAGIAADILAILDRRRALVGPRRTAPTPVPLDSLAAIPSGARRVLDRSGAEETSAMVRARFAGCTIDRHPDGSYDVVLAGYALARAIDIDRELAAACATLDAGGRLVAQFTNARNLRYLTSLVGDERWAAKRVGRNEDAVVMSVRDVETLFARHGLEIESLHFANDRSLAAIDEDVPGESNLGVGDITVNALTHSDLREFKMTTFVVVGKRCA